jgi:tetratricopeptide (TPR) repeat protein
MRQPRRKRSCTNQTNPRARIALAHKALAISPLCADAYVLLAEEEAKSAEEALEYYCKGVEAGEQALGTKRFKQYAGHFWGFIETRPYMRARAGLAAILNMLGEVDAAISNYQEMPVLNPNDNQGIRYRLGMSAFRSRSMMRIVARSGSIRRRLSPSGKMMPTTRGPNSWQKSLEGE